MFWVVDNGSSHNGERSIERMQQAWPTATLVHLPVHASWLNQVEIYFSILPKHLLGEVKPSEIARSPFWTQNRVGTGPFKWTKYVPDQYIVVVRNDDYFLGKPKVNRIVYRIFADIPGILNALAANEIDVMSYEGGGVPVSEIDGKYRAFAAPICAFAAIRVCSACSRSGRRSSKADGTPAGTCVG